eukprot:CAMPEP_0114628138 /NCGR_PEP_ID=MMETSP0168-20121206/12660_1 /TAXON_ID=95228 ORGANISM="Vannella sp., Strain DIVA3 517/6/12" /NCGR_SAMPLE_ID=MMETSP0168 /ASSEMBLY_ACC=CAM_ASM_000044 /LENGTH=437 /DNA_ID=CAMNT_0001839499 /DNA_START=59 /DNA_END=1369 /DNA_ORIENTATION=-
MCTAVAFRGSVSPGYEPVLEEFKSQFAKGWHVGAGFAAFANGEKVVDIQGGDASVADAATGTPAEPFDEHTLTFVASCTKFAESLVIALLVARGQLAYDEPIAKYWPEFAQHGKGHITVGQLMQHRAGIPVIQEKLGADLLLNNNDGLSELLARQELVWEVPSDSQIDPAPQQAYHGITRGLYADQLCMRVDPRKRSIGQVLRDDVCEKICAEFYIGLPDDLLASPRQATNVQGPAMYVMHKLGLAPELPEDMKKLEGDETVNFTDYELAFLKDLFTDPKSWASRSLMLLDMKPDDKKTNRFGVSDFVLSCSLPSSNGVTNTSSLAALAEVVRTGGHFQGTPIFPDSGSKTINAASALAGSYSDDLIMRTPVRFTRGGFAQFFAEDSGKTECFGWGGAGGSMVRWCPSKKVACAFSMNKLGLRMAMNDPRGNRLLAT